MTEPFQSSDVSSPVVTLLQPHDLYGQLQFCGHVTGFATFFWLEINLFRWFLASNARRNALTCLMNVVFA